MRELELSAKSGPSCSAQNFPRSPALDDWFTAANSSFALTRSGQFLPFAGGDFLVSQPLGHVLKNRGL